MKDYGLERNAFKKNRKWEVDNLDPKEGYIKDLKELSKSKNKKVAQEAKDALKWIQKFNNEYYDNCGLNKVDALHNTKELRRDCYSRMNAANRDLFGIKNCGFHLLVSIDELEYDQGVEMEDIIEYERELERGE